MKLSDKFRNRMSGNVTSALRSPNTTRHPQQLDRETMLGGDPEIEMLRSALGEYENSSWSFNRKIADQIRQNLSVAEQNLAVPDSSGRYYVSPDTGEEGATTTLGRVSRAMENDYKSRFLPHELDIYDSLDNPELTRRQVNRSGILAAHGMDSAKATAERTMRSYGTSLNNMQREEFDDRFNRNKKLAEIDARNSSRLAKKDRDMNALAGGANLKSQTMRNSPDG